jgi:tyrosyl-tRNA synthetase
VTLGWAVVLRKLRHFQEMGHTAVLIVGDFTAQVGDPSQRSDARKRLTAEEVNGYAENVLGQFRSVLLDERLEIRRNSEWLGALEMGGLLELTSAATVAQMLERSDFANRYQEGSPISVMEFLYPLLQGYDSVAVEADVELGGSDQLWNLMMGRVVQERYGQEPQVALTMPLLVGTDGTKKMSQSLGNYVGVEDEPGQMFGKTMSIPDQVMPEWFRLAADFDPEEAAQIESGLANGDVHPGEAKRRLARAVTALYWGEAAAAEAEAGFDQVFRHGGTPDDIEEFPLPAGEKLQMSSLVREVSGVSGSEARRLLAQGAVRLDGEVVEDGEIARTDLAGRVLKVGKRRFVRLSE